MNDQLSNMHFDTLGSFAGAEGTDLATLANLQKEAGLQTLTDGNATGIEWNLKFFSGFNGLEEITIDSGRVYQEYPSMTGLLRLISPITYAGTHPLVERMKELAGHATEGIIVKQQLPAPASLLGTLLFESKWQAVYPSEEALVADISKAYSELIADLYDAGCRMIQFNDYSWAPFTSDTELNDLLRGGVDIEKYVNLLIKANNDALANIPSDMATAIYITRALIEFPLHPGGRMPMLPPKVFSDSKFDIFYLDLHAAKDNDFTFFAHIPTGKKLMMGVISPADYMADFKDSISYNFKKASEYYPMENLGITFRTGLAEASHRYPDTATQWNVISRAAEAVKNALS